MGSLKATIMGLNGLLWDYITDSVKIVGVDM